MAPKLIPVVALTCALAFAQDYPDVTKGHVDGVQAMLAIPLPKSTNPERCEVHLVPNSRPNERFIEPCGKWFLPPAEDLYTVWIEDGGRVSRTKTPVRYWRTPFNGSGFVTELATVEAGFLRLKNGVSLREGETLRIGSLTVPNYGFERRAHGVEASRALAMPPGRVIAGIYDAGNNVVALAPLVDLAAGQTVTIEPRRPAKGSDVFLVLTKPSNRKTGKEETALFLLTGDSRRKPDAVHDVVGRFYAVWYGVEASEATLLVESNTFKYAGPAIVLKNREVSTVRVRADLK
jgi:hypothetical protein